MSKGKTFTMYIFLCCNLHCTAVNNEKKLHSKAIKGPEMTYVIQIKQKETCWLMYQKMNEKQCYIYLWLQEIKYPTENPRYSFLSSCIDFPMKPYFHQVFFVNYQVWFRCQILVGQLDLLLWTECELFVKSIFPLLKE